MLKDSTKETLVGLFEATNVPVEQQEQFTAIFEAAVAVEAKEVAERVYEAVVADAEAEKEQLQEKMNEYSEYLIAEYADKLDQYLDYTTEKLFEENKLAITNGVKAKMFDSLVEGIKNVVHEHGIAIADEQVDVVAELEESMAEQTAELNAAKHEVIALRGQIAKMNKAVAIQEATKQLTQTQIEKVVALAEELNYDETFDGKLQTLVEAVTQKAAPTKKDEPQFITETRKLSLKDICNL